jgi:hypothetical protein
MYPLRYFPAATCAVEVEMLVAICWSERGVDFLSRVGLRVFVGEIRRGCDFPFDI